MSSLVRFVVADRPFKRDFRCFDLNSALKFGVWAQFVTIPCLFCRIRPIVTRVMAMRRIVNRERSLTFPRVSA